MFLWMKPHINVPKLVLVQVISVFKIGLLTSELVLKDMGITDLYKTATMGIDPKVFYTQIAELQPTSLYVPPLEIHYRISAVCH